MFINVFTMAGIEYPILLEYMYKCMHYKDTCSSSSRGQKSTWDS